MATCDLRLGDCLDVMAGFDTGCIDLTVTSPPYDNLRSYNGSLNDWTEEKWKAIIAELYRVTKDGGVVVWVVGDATINGSETGTSFKQALWAMECGFRLHDTMIYHTDGVGARGSNSAYWNSFEFMFVLSKGSPLCFNPINDRANVGAGRKTSARSRRADGTMAARRAYTIAPFGKRLNVWTFQGGARAIKDHPATFPEALARDHIISWSNPGDTVLDPFMGSGTTGKMALLHGRNFIGIERVPEYFAIAQRRIPSNDNNPDIFAAAA